VPAERHCPGCRGYTTDWRTGCPGIPAAGSVQVFSAVVPQLGWRDRLRVLAGQPVMAVTGAVNPPGGAAGGSRVEKDRDE
jgi:hypothetical protein